MCTVGLFFVTKENISRRRCSKRRTEPGYIWLDLWMRYVQWTCTYFFRWAISNLYRSSGGARQNLKWSEMQTFMVKTRLSRGPPTKQFRCNPDVAPRTSGGYEDKVDVITPINIALRGWQILIPYEDKVDVFAPINILFIGGGEFWFLMKIKLILVLQSTYCSEGVADFNVMIDGDDDDDVDDHDDCKCGATSGLGRIVF